MSSPFPVEDNFIHKVKRTCINATPKDTGNLAYNSLSVYKTTDGFTVLYRASIAGYGSLLNDFRRLKGFASGGLNKHYLWFDNGVHNNVLNQVIREYSGKNKTKKETIIEPTARTFEGQAQYRFKANSGNSIEQINTTNELNQLERLRSFSSRYEQYKNQNVKGWGI